MSGVQTLSANALKERLAARKSGGAAAVGSKKAVKTAAQLEEEEARMRALDMEIEEMERRDRERWQRFYRLFRPPDVSGAVRRYFADKVKIALHRLQDKNGRIFSILEQMQVKKKKEKLMYIKFWMDLDDKRRNQVSYDRFCKYFRMPADPWTKRLFDLMNVSLTGTLSFYDFLAFCQKCLLVDKFQTEEFGYRMFSRRGQTFQAKFSVLDLEDMRLFLKYRFKISNPKELSKIALDVFEYVDSDGDGGLFFDEWQDFNKRNWVFVRYFHCYLTHLRKCIFGIKYWVEKTRVVKAKNAKGTDNFSFTSRINLRDESWTVADLKDGVIDGRNRPVVTQPWVESDDKKDDVTKGLDSKQKEEADDLAQELLDEKDNPEDPVWQEGADLTEEGKKKRAEEEEKRKEAEEAANSKKSRKDKAKEAEERQKKRKQEKENAGKKAQDETNPYGLKGKTSTSAGGGGGAGGGAGADAGAGADKKKGEEEDGAVRKRNFILVGGKLQEFKGDELNTGAYVDTRKEVAWRGPLLFTNAAKRKFEEDFVEVHVKRLQKKYLKDLKKKEERDISKKMAGRTYKKLVRVCEDIIYARKWLRLGFNRWAEAVGMENVDNLVEKKSEVDLIAGKREAGRKQMAKLMSQSVKQKGLLGGKKLTKEEQAELNRLEEEQRLLAEAEAKAKAAAEKKLAEEEGEYMLHATILKNCKKQEEEIHDEDNVFAGYVSEEKRRLNLPLVKGLAHRHTHVKASYDLFLLGDPDIDGLVCLSEMAAREELKSRASTTFSSKPNTRGHSRGRSRGVSRGQSRGSPSPTRGRSGSPSRGLMQSRVDSSHARRKAAELPPPGTKLPGLTGGLRALLPKTSIVAADDLRFGLSSAGRRERDHLEEEGLPATQRSLSPPGERKWAVDAGEDLEDVDPDSFYIDTEFEPIWYPHFNDPEIPIENRKSNPERSYIFESDRKEKVDDADSDDSSVDL